MRHEYHTTPQEYDITPEEVQLCTYNIEAQTLSCNMNMTRHRHGDTLISKKVGHDTFGHIIFILYNNKYVMHMFIVIK